MTIIHQNDTHGYLQEHPEMFWKSGSTIHEVGGFSRIHHHVRDVKKNTTNVLFVDGGDLFHGTAPLVLTNGEGILPLLKEMEIDAFVPGNWDYAYGKSQLLNLVSQLPFPALACNLKDKETNQFLFQPYTVKELNDVKVGIIGATYPYVHETMADNFSKGLSFSLGVDEIERSVDILKQQNVDVIILLSHMGLPLDYKIASLVDGISIILSGHSHDRTSSPIINNDTLIIQAGSSSSFLGQIEITCKEGKIVEYKHQLISLTAKEYKKDETINEIIEEILKPFKEMEQDVIGKTDTLLHRMTLNEAPMDKLITDAYMHGFDGDIAFSHGWRYGVPIVPGEITMNHLYNMIPTNPEVFQLDVEGQLLYNVLEKNLELVFSSDPFNQKGGYILRSSGLMMTYKPYNPKGNRIQYLEINGEPYLSSKTYKIIGAGDQLFKGLHNQKKYKKIHSIDVIKNYLSDIPSFKNDGMGKIISI